MLLEFIFYAIAATTAAFVGICIVAGLIVAIGTISDIAKHW
jgi:hypothetical protein